MRIPALVLLLLQSAIAVAAPAAPAGGSPADRQATDPLTIESDENPDARPIPVDDLYYTRRTSDAAWSPDGKEISFTTNMTGRSNLWKVAAEGGWPVQLAQSDESQSAGQWSRDGRWIVFESDHGGDEQYDVLAVPSKGGLAVNLTQTPEVSEEPQRFSPDGKTLAIRYKPRTAASADIALLPFSPDDGVVPRIRNLTKETAKDWTWTNAIWSPDGRFLYATRLSASFIDSSVFRVSVADGQQEELTAHTGDNLFGVTDISPDGRTLLLNADENGQPNVALLDVATRKITFLTHTRWMADAGSFSPKGDALTYSINTDGQTVAYVFTRATGRSTPIPFPGGLTSFTGNPRPFSPDGRRLILERQDGQHPNDLWVFDRAGNRLRQLSFSALASLQPAAIPQAQLIQYESFDGQIISAYLTMPFNLKRDQSNPAVVLPHGGPAGQVIDSFDSVAVALASRGYVCISPNVRGSSGYGNAFLKANHQDLGGGDLEDEIAATKFLDATGYVDSHKIGISGGSYGGFMSLMAIGKRPAVWAAAVERCGIIDWISMLQGADAGIQEYEKTLLGDPVKDRAVYENASPMKYLRNATAPLLVLQGENDIRVPKAQADEVAQLLHGAGKVVDVHYYSGEGHGWRRRETMIDALDRTIAWFDKYLRPAAKGAGGQ